MIVQLDLFDTLAEEKKSTKRRKKIYDPSKEPLEKKINRALPNQKKGKNCPWTSQPTDKENENENQQT